jgi:phosphohistidine phosphatase
MRIKPSTLGVPGRVRSLRVKRLLLLRHAKSSWKEVGLADHDRPLAPRGRRAAKLMAGHLRAQGIDPGLVLCSSARRARETLEGIQPALPADAEVRIDDDLYAASARDLMERVRALPDAVQSAMLIGHNPAMSAVALGLAEGGDDLPKLERKFPTAALATLAFAGIWRELEYGGAELVGFVTPRELQ